jgi:lipid-binding SYLF domain-containing protein
MTVLGDRDGKDTYPEAYTKGHGGIADPKIPDQFSGFLEAGLKALEHGSKIPKALIRACAGVCLLEAGEGGLVVSMHGCNGVALQHKDGKWSNPVAVNILSVGGGAVFGYANKTVIVLLNNFAMDRLLKGNGSIAIGVDAEFAVGKVGRARCIGGD